MELSFAGLGVELDGRNVLDSVAAVLRPGRITAILGPNGAGKSTLLKAAAALVTPVAGTVRLGDRPIEAIPARERARLIGYLPQDGRVQWNLRVGDVVAAGPGARIAARLRQPPTPIAAPSPPRWRRPRTSQFVDRTVDTLSGGERARVLLARALAGEPAWLLADEPLASLDPAHQLDMLARLRDFAGRDGEGGRGVAIVLHDLLHAGRVADDVLLIRGGRVIAFGRAEEVLTPERLRAVFDIDIAVTRDPHGRLLCIPGAD